MKINVIFMFVCAVSFLFSTVLRQCFAVLIGNKLALLFHLLFFSYMVQDVSGTFVIFYSVLSML